MRYFLLVYLLGTILIFGHALNNTSFVPESPERAVAAFGSAMLWPLYISWDVQREDQDAVRR